MENLLGGWREFRRGKTSKEDVQKFAFHLEDNLFDLHERLVNKEWKADPYIAFYIRDPKLRHIHKATVRDRVFNQSVFRILYPIFDPTFIHHSYSCRVKKGTHKGFAGMESSIRKVTQNHTKVAYMLKCDIKKFFANISHEILLSLIEKKVKDEGVMNIIRDIIGSFETSPGKGLPLGNVTSQLFANVYLNELDQFVKHMLKEKHYFRYCDDFIILNRDKERLLSHMPKLDEFLKKNLGASLHPQKIVLRKVRQGADFLGYVARPHHRVLRPSTRRRVLRKVGGISSAYKRDLISEEKFTSTLHSYYGILSHCKGHKIYKEVLKLI